MSPITVEACTLASREVIRAAQLLDATNHTFQLFSQGGVWWDFRSPKTLDNVTVNEVAFEAEISLFQIARGRSALLQWHDWSFTESKRFIWSPALDIDYGEPLGPGIETHPGVFTREFSRAGAVTLNCSAFVADLHAQP